MTCSLELPMQVVGGSLGLAKKNYATVIENLKAAVSATQSAVLQHSHVKLDVEVPPFEMLPLSEQTFTVPIEGTWVNVCVPRSYEVDVIQRWIRGVIVQAQYTRDQVSDTSMCNLRLLTIRLQLDIEHECLQARIDWMVADSERVHDVLRTGRQRLHDIRRALFESLLRGDDETAQSVTDPIEPAAHALRDELRVGRGSEAASHSDAMPPAYSARELQQ